MIELYCLMIVVGVCGLISAIAWVCMVCQEYLDGY